MPHRRVGTWSWRGGCLGLVTTIVVGGALVTAAPVHAVSNEITGNRVSLTFDTTDPERVVSVEWKDTAKVWTPNLVAQGGPTTCGDPSEFFGQAYGAPEGTKPYPVFSGHVATATFTSHAATMVGSKTDCNGNPVIKTTTNYKILSGAAASSVEITRRFGFNKATGLQGDRSAGYVGLRVYVPRVSDSVFTDVIYPNHVDTAVTDVAVSTCPFDCFTKVGKTWNGKWLADVSPSNGDALIILRAPTMTAPVEMTVNYDSYSASNLASFVLVQPKAGWNKPVTETETLCFADLTSWPPAARAAGKLPAGCGAS